MFRTNRYMETFIAYILKVSMRQRILSPVYSEEEDDGAKGSATGGEADEGEEEPPLLHHPGASPCLGDLRSHD